MINHKLIQDSEIFFDPEKKEKLSELDHYIRNIYDNHLQSTLISSKSRAETLGRLYSSLSEGNEELISEAVEELEQAIGLEEITYLELKSRLSSDILSKSTIQKVKKLISQLLHVEIGEMNRTSNAFLSRLVDKRRPIDLRLYELSLFFPLFIELEDTSTALKLQKHILKCIQEMQTAPSLRLLLNDQIDSSFLSSIRTKETDSEDLKKGFLDILCTLFLFQQDYRTAESFNPEKTYMLLDEFFTFKSRVDSFEIREFIDEFILENLDALTAKHTIELEKLIEIVKKIHPQKAKSFKIQMTKDLIQSIEHRESDTLVNLESAIEKLLFLKNHTKGLTEELNRAIQKLEQKLSLDLERYEKHQTLNTQRPSIDLESIKSPRMRCNFVRYNPEGQDLNYFDEQSKVIVSLGSKKIEEVLPKECVLHKDLENHQMKALFKHLLEFFGTERQKIAKHQRTPLANHFGVKREEEGFRLKTPLNGRYQEYGRVIWENISTTAVGITENEFIDDLIFFTETVEIPVEEKIVKQKLCKLQYKDKKPFILSDFTRTLESDFVIIHHQHPDLIHYAEEILERYFILALASENAEEVTKNLAVFRFIFGHSAPYSRGSAAIAEWFEKAIYEYRGYESSYGEALSDEHFRPVGDLDAYTVTLAEYITLYKERIFLRELE